MTFYERAMGKLICMYKSARILSCHLIFSPTQPRDAESSSAGASAQCLATRDTVLAGWTIRYLQRSVCLCAGSVSGGEDPIHAISFENLSRRVCLSLVVMSDGDTLSGGDSGRSV